MPVRVELGERAGEPLRHRQAPQRMELDHDVHAVADGLADLGERFERGIELGRRDVPAGRALGGDVEGPDLHAGDALLEQRQGKLVGAMQEGFEVLVGTLLVADAPVGDGLAALVADVLVARAGVVDADAIAAPAAQRLADRPADRLAEQIPQRDVDRRVAARLHAGAAPAEIVDEALVDRLDLDRVAADQLGRGALMDVGLDGSGAHEGLAEAGQTLVGPQPDPDEVGEFAQPDGLDGGDLHASRRLACRRGWPRRWPPRPDPANRS